MAKLKCWKKKVTYPNNIAYTKNEGGYVEMIGFKDKSWDVISKDKNWDKKTFKTKSQALSHANKYMKSHNKC